MGVVEVKERYERHLLQIPGVMGVGADVVKGEIVVYVRDSSVCKKLPFTLSGYPVRCMVVGMVRI